MQIEKVVKSFRMLTKADFEEFKRAATESTDSNMEYLYFGQFFDHANVIEIGTRTPDPVIKSKRK